MDLAGHGESSWITKKPYDRATLVADITHVINTLGLSRLILVGHSMGGNLALWVATQMRDQVEALILVDAAPTPPPAARKHLLSELKDSIKSYTGIDEYAKELATRRPLAKKNILAYIAMNALCADTENKWRMKVDPEVRQLLAPHDEHELWSAIEGIHCPTLIVRGGLSGVLSQQAAEELTRRIPDARLALVSGAGHAVMLDSPFGFRAALEPFIHEIASAHARTSEEATSNTEKTSNEADQAARDDGRLCSVPYIQRPENGGQMNLDRSFCDTQLNRDALI
jgi:pimeloyl-ACP methyl ester carboxylesterase